MFLLILRVILILLLFSSFAFPQTEEEKYLKENPEIVLQLGHTAPVTSVIYSPDGKYVVSGSEDHTIKITEINSLAILKTLKGHGGIITAMAYSPGGKYIASASLDRTIRIWDMKSFTCVKVIEGQPYWISSLIFSPDGNYIASVSVEEESDFIKIWDINTGNCFKKLQAYSDKVTSLSYSPDGKSLVSASGDKNITLWNLEEDTGKFFKFDSIISLVTYLPCGNKIAFISEDKLKIWDMKKREISQVIETGLLNISSLVCSPDGNFIALASDKDQKIDIIDINTGEKIKSIDAGFPLIESLKHVFRPLVFSCDGKNLTFMAF